MTKEEIKENVTMDDVLSMYSIEKNRYGYINCPFHREKTSSCKIYKDHFFCYGCHASGDVFDFVRRYEGVSFQKAFKILGGSEPKTDAEYLAAWRNRKARKKKRIEKQKREQEHKDNLARLKELRHLLEIADAEHRDAWDLIKDITQEELKLAEWNDSVYEGRNNG